jgi:hypothetical protein
MLLIALETPLAKALQGSHRGLRGLGRHWQG